MSRREKKDAAMAWLERTNPLTGMTIRDLQNVFDCARNGDTQRLHWIFNEIESVNPVLLVCVERRASAVANFQWRVSERASQDGQLSAEQKDAVETFLGDIENLTEAFEHLDLAFFRGFAHCQPIWEKDGTVREISLLDSWKFVRQGGEWFYNPECTGFSSDMQSCANARLMTVTRRRPIDYPALGIHVRDAVGNRDWGRFLERHALPKPAVTMHQGATDEQKRDYLEAAECVENGQVSVWPFGSSLTDFAGGSRGVDPFKNFIEHQERRIVLLATGGTLMSLAESGTGTLAGNAQTDVWESIVARDSSVIAQAVTRSLVRPYLAKAFPGKPACVDFGFDFTKQPTPKEVAEVAATLKTAGWRIDQGELEEATGFTLEKEEAENQPMPGGFGGVFANKSAPDARNPLANRLQNAPQGADGQGEGQDPAALLGPFLSALKDDCKPLAKEVEILLKDPTPEKARALLEKIPEMVPENPALAPLLAEEMAKAYGEAFGRARTPAAPVAANKKDANGREHGEGSDNHGQFVKEGEVGSEETGDGEKPKDGGDTSSGAPSETTAESGTQGNPDAASAPDEVAPQKPIYSEEHFAKIGQSGTAESLGLPDFKDVEPDPIPPETDPEDARRRLDEGIHVTTPMGKELELNLETTHHHLQHKKAKEDYDERIQNLDAAIETFQNPHEIWLDETTGRNLYVRLMKSKDGRKVINAVDKNAKGWSWHVKHDYFDGYRHGKLVYLRGKNEAQG